MISNYIQKVPSSLYFKALTATLFAVLVYLYLYLYLYLWLLAAGCWLLAGGCWLLAVGCWQSLVSSEPVHTSRAVSVAWRVGHGGGSFAGWRGAQAVGRVRASALQDLTRRGCLNGAFGTNAQRVPRRAPRPSTAAQSAPADHPA